MRSFYDTMDHKHTPEEERRIREAALDHTLAETFPASDPPSTLPDPEDDDVLNDPAFMPPPVQRGTQWKK